MGLFDNLFKAKPDAADEAVVEAAKRIAEHEKARLLEASRLPAALPAARPGIVPTGKPAPVVPAPRAYSPRTLGQVVAPARPARSGEVATRKIRFTAHDEAVRPHEVVLTVEDVLSRIPMELVAEEPHNLGRELRFRVEDLSADIARGRAAVSLGSIAAQVPDLFRAPIAHDDARQIRLPLQKLVEQIGFLPIKPPATTGGADPVGTAVPSPALPPPPGPGPTLPAETAGSTSAVSAPGGSAENDSGPANLRISLSLAAVLKTCPSDLIVANLPPISESDRISFAWPAIEKQLQSGGPVEVSSVRFIFALPAHLHGYFEAREGVRVPLPIEEIRRNLPGPASASVRELPQADTSADVQRTAQAGTGELDEEAIPVVVFARKPAATPEESIPEHQVPSDRLPSAVEAESPAEAAAPAPRSDQEVPAAPPAAVPDAGDGAAPRDEVEGEFSAAPLTSDAWISQAGGFDAPVADPALSPAQIEVRPLELPPPLVAHVPPALSVESAAAAAVLIAPPVPAITESVGTELSSTAADGDGASRAESTPGEPAGPPIFVPPPLRQSGDFVAVEPGVASPAPPNVWMQPPPELAARTHATPPRAPDLTQPTSPILPVRVITPPVARPLVAPPPLFAGSTADTHAVSMVVEVPVPAAPLNLGHARTFLGVGDDATLADLGAALLDLPGLKGCHVIVRGEAASAGEFPPDFNPGAVSSLSTQFSAAIESAGDGLGGGRVQHITLFAEETCVSLFIRGQATICAYHRTRAFLPGVCERLCAAAAALAQA